MKKHSILLALVCLIGTPAWGSKARLQSLGQSTNGSQYILDNRSIFLNPAQILQLKEFVNFEMGTSTGTSETTDPSTWPATGQHAEGGLVKNWGSSMLALQLGRKSNAGTHIASANTIAGAGFDFIEPRNTIDLTIGGSVGNAWGFGLTYGAAQADAEIPTGATSAFPNKKAHTLELRGGLANEQWDGWVHLNLLSKSEHQVSATRSDTFEGKPSIRLGGTYNLNREQKAYANLDYRGYSARDNGNTVDFEDEYFGLVAGFYQALNTSDAHRFFATLGLGWDQDKLKNKTAGTDTKTEHLYIPVLLGLEANATEWLILRASVSQRVLWDQTKTTSTDNHVPNSTTVSTGAGFLMKNFTLDGVLSASTSGNINTADLLAVGGLTYTF